eukprot:m.232578 g.232578  ORF g.232578 m.232578 type:complete len:136 (+) comp17374_c0_seq12:126-533(+)
MPAFRSSPSEPIQGVYSEDELDEALFSGLDLRKKGTATIRGKRNGVRKTLAQLNEVHTVKQKDQLARLYDQENRDKAVVLYTTSTTANRAVHSACEQAKSLLYRLRVKVTTKNIAMDKGVGMALGRPTRYPLILS